MRSVGGARRDFQEAWHIWAYVGRGKGGASVAMLYVSGARKRVPASTPNVGRKMPHHAIYMYIYLQRLGAMLSDNSFTSVRTS